MTVRSRAYTVVLAAAMVAPASVASAADWWIGQWASEPAWCANAGGTSGTDAIPIVISEAEIIGYESHCSVTKTRNLKAVNGVILVADCTAEGDSFKQRLLLLREDADRIWMWRGNGEPYPLRRCGG